MMHIFQSSRSPRQPSASRAAASPASKRQSQLQLLVLCSLLAPLFIACQKHTYTPVPKNRSGETLVPEETQQESQEMYGEQEMMMNDLNQTGSERSGAQHDHAVGRGRHPERETRKQ